METFAILGFTLGAMGFIFAASAFAQTYSLKKKVEILEDKISFK